MKNVNDCIIIFKGISNGKHPFSFELDSSFFKQFEGAEIEQGSLVAEVMLDKQSAVMQLSVTIRGTVTVVCDRCLDDLPLPVNTNGVLTIRFDKAGETQDDDVMILDPAESEMNLSQYFFDSIHLALPLQRVHPNGQCNPEMIAKLQSFIINND